MSEGEWKTKEDDTNFAAMLTKLMKDNNELKDQALNSSQTNNVCKGGSNQSTNRPRASAGYQASTWFKEKLIPGRKDAFQ